MAPIRPARMTNSVTYLRSTMPAPTVLATPASWKKSKGMAAMKFQKAAQRTAWNGVRTRVATTVATELAASWKPLM